MSEQNGDHGDACRHLDLAQEEIEKYNSTLKAGASERPIEEGIAAAIRLINAATHMLVLTRANDQLRTQVEQLTAKVDAVPGRETFWLLERLDRPAWALYTSSGRFVHAFTKDVWQAARFKNERHAHDVWRMLTADERKRWKPVEHMFINKIQPDTSVAHID
jgi:hypothetical protein